MTETTTKSEQVKQARREYMKRYKQNLTEEQKEHERAYQRHWRQQNRDKVKAHQEAYWLRKYEEMKQEG